MTATAHEGVAPLAQASDLRLRLALAMLAVASVVAVPNATGPIGGSAPGDASQLLRLIAVHAAAALGLALFHRRAAPAALDWLAVCLPAWSHLGGFPAQLALVAFAPLAAALLRAASLEHRILLGALSAATQILGAAGWIFHYFVAPTLPATVALAVSWGVWIPACLGAAALLARSPLWLPVAAACWPASEWLRATASSPPLPGLFLSHAISDTALARIAASTGELGLSWLASLVAFAAALAWQRSPARARPAVAALVVAASGSMSLGGDVQPPGPGAARVCSVEDPHRSERRSAPFGGGDGAAISAIAARAVNELHCDVTVFPEYSLELHERSVLTREQGRHRPPEPVLVGGVYSMTRDARRRPLHTRNVVCRMHRDGGDRFACSDPLDKLVFAPFGEAALFHDSPLLAGIGRWMSQQATGETYFGVEARRTQGVVEAGRFALAGSICWEILLPDIFGQRGIEPGDASLLVVPSDLDGFGGSFEAIEQFRRAGRVHARRLRTPLLFASTHGAFALDARGAEVQPVHREPFIVAYELALPERR